MSQLDSVGSPITRAISILRLYVLYYTRRGAELMRHPSRLRRFPVVLRIAKLFVSRPRPSVLFIGYVEAALGHGESLRNLLVAIAETDLPFAIYPFNRAVEDRIVGPFMENLYDRKGRHQVNVIEMAADQVPVMLSDLEWKICDSYNILRTYWELAQTPPEWGSLLDSIDELWVPNRFVRDSFATIFKGPITIMPPCVNTSCHVSYERKYFGMSNNIFYFLFTFDYLSSPFRKNPLAVVRAFELAFPPYLGEPVGLVMKSMNGGALHCSEVEAAMVEAGRRDQRINAVDLTLSRDQLLSLVSQCDCYVSLHRSEGFGLGMAEALALGKAVIGTNYSGNTDFLSDATGFPVPYTLRPVLAGEYFYPDGQVWAEPDVSAAAEAMRRVFEDPKEREIRAAAGKALVHTRYGRENVGKIAERRLHDILSSGAGHSCMAMKHRRSRSEMGQ